MALPEGLPGLDCPVRLLLFFIIVFHFKYFLSSHSFSFGFSFAFVQFRLIENTLCISGWPLIYNPPASASQELQLKAYATTPSSSIFFIVWRTFLLFIKSFAV